MIEILQFYIAFALLFMLFLAALSPFETLGWWAGWIDDKVEFNVDTTNISMPSTQENPGAYILYLSGVGRVSGNTFGHRETLFLQKIENKMPDAMLVDKFFPYSVSNQSLTRQPFFSLIWNMALQCKLNGPKFAGNVINLRNIFQVLISADNRYGPMYNQGYAKVMLEGLLGAGYDMHSKVPVFIIAYSGSCQIAIGSAKYIEEWVGIPIYIISMGGIFRSDPGLQSIVHLFHLQGTRDWVPFLSYLSCGRWPIFSNSEWNKAVQSGKITQFILGPMSHTGRGSYIDHKSRLSSGETFVDETVNTIAAVVENNLELHRM